MFLRSNERLLIGRDAADAARLACERISSAFDGTGDERFVALAGGSTPKLLYSLLSAPPWVASSPWQRIHWFWGDERQVAPDHPESNYRMAWEALLSPTQVSSDHIHRMPADAADIGRAGLEYERLIQERVPPGPSGIPAFDLVLLGVGPDGHTASLFPDTPALDESQRLVVANFVPRLAAWRLTMTFPLLMAAREILFLVTGAAKAEIMARILASPPGPGADGKPCPAARFREANTSVSWVLDADAARLVAPTARL